jgi:predicted unusual protein kinase regulating ubiquinone biosynthesis (AarF/ABC1/UbiB family)
MLQETVLSRTDTITVPSQAIDTYEDTELAYDEPNADWRYSPEINNAQYRRRPFLVLGRLIAILFPFTRFVLGVWGDGFTGNSIPKQKKRARQLIKILTKLGPAYIKIGQALSTRPDVVPPAYLEELTTLQDKIS